MLLRLQVKGFKSLRDIDIRFGPLTCFVGLNGVGKSNIFDAIQFLRFLADDEIHVAAEKVRSTASGKSSPLELFWGQNPSGRIRLEADMIVPLDSLDDFGQPVTPAINLLKYSVEFSFQSDPAPRLVLEQETLRHHNKGDARSLIGFPHNKAFRDSVVKGRRSGGAFLSTKTGPSGAPIIELHGDGGARGRPMPVPAGPSPRTILGGTGTGNYPTIVAARREMASWKTIQLEPSSLRSPDSFGDPSTVDEHGRHLASTLYRLQGGEEQAGHVLQEARNRLADLVPGVKELRIDRDEAREQVVLKLRMRNSETWLAPRSLSDGTLRFLALITLEMDPHSCRLLCMEEPENGIHPSRMPAMIQLLDDYAAQPDEAIDSSNPLRQVILNTHSPEVIRQLDAPQVLFVDSIVGKTEREAIVRPVRTNNAWRDMADAVEIGELVRLVGGSPISSRLGERQLSFRFGTAT